MAHSDIYTLLIGIDLELLNFALAAAGHSVTLMALISLATSRSHS